MDIRARIYQQLQRIGTRILRGIEKSRAAVRVGQMNIRTGFNQCGGHGAGVVLTAPRACGAGGDERRPAVCGAGIDVCAQFAQHLHGGDIAPFHRVPQRGLPVLVGKVNVCLLFNQVVENGNVVVFDGIVQGAAPFAVGGVDLRAVRQQRLHGLQVIFVRRQHQGSKTFFVGGIDIRALLQEGKKACRIIFFGGGVKLFFGLGHWRLRRIQLCSSTMPSGRVSSCWQSS